MIANANFDARKIDLTPYFTEALADETSALKRAIRPIVAHNQAQGRLNYFLDRNPQKTPADYIKKVAQNYKENAPFFTALLVDEKEAQWEEMMGKMFHWAYRLLARRNVNFTATDLQRLSEDAANMAAAQLFQSGANFPYDTPPEGWIYKILHNLALAEMRQAFDRKEFANEAGLDDLAETLAMPGQLNPEAQFTQQEKYEAVVVALEQISERQRQIIMYRYVDEVSMEEICAKMDMNRNAAYQLQHQALKNLRKYLERG